MKVTFSLSRLLSPFCHMERVSVHPGSVVQFHPGRVERHHESQHVRREHKCKRVSHK